MLYTTLGIYLGVLFAFVWKARAHIQHGYFSPSIWWSENKMRFTWAVVFAAIVSAVINFYPDAVDVFEFIGFNMSSENGSLSEILIGLFVTYATYSNSTDKQKLETNEN